MKPDSSEEEVIFFESRAELRAWLAENHDTASVLEAGFYKKSSGRPSAGYDEAVEEALCFGWIDGVRHAIGADSYRNRFTPRKPRSNWSAVNIKRVEKLKQQGLMHEAGLRAYEQRDAQDAPYSYQQSQGLEEPYLSQLRANARAWSFFSSQPPGYQRTAGFWVTSAKREETRQKRLATLIADSEAGRRIALLRRDDSG